MALGSNKPRTYLSVADGKITQNVPEGTPGAISRINANNKTVFELKHDYVSGIVTGIRIKENDFNGKKMKSWVLDLIDGDDSYSLEMPYDSSWAMTMFNAFANPEIDFTRPLKFNPWQKEEGGKKKRCLYVNQGENRDSIQWMFTKDEPNGLPPLVETMLKGEKVWDNYDRMQFVEKLVNDHIIPQLPSASAAALSADAIVPPHAEKTESAFADVKHQATIEKDDDDDLPF